MRRSKFLETTGIETLSIGAYLIYQQHYFQDDPRNQFIHLAAHFGDVGWAVALIAIGFVVTIIGLTGFNRWHAQTVALILLSGLFFAYFVALVMEDVHFDNPVRLGTLMVGWLFIRTLVEARYGGGGDVSNSRSAD